MAKTASEPEKIRTCLYHLVSKDPSITEKYIGYTTQYHTMIANWYDTNLKQPQYMNFIDDHGGIDEWDVKIIKMCESREDAQSEKSLYLFAKPDEYTLNKYGFYKKPTRRYFHRSGDRVRKKTAATIATCQ